MKELKWYSIMKIHGSLLAGDNVVQGYNSKDALERLIGKKVKRALRNIDPADFSVALSNSNGDYYADARKKVFFKVI